MRKILIFLAVFLPLFTVAQRRSCAQPDYTANKQPPHSFLNKIIQLERNTPFSCDSLIIPIAIHFQGTSADRDCLEDFVEKQLAIINDDFGGNNVDLDKYLMVKGIYNVDPGRSCIKFKLADKNHPKNFGLIDGMKAITINAFQDADYSAFFNGYLNLFVKQIGEKNQILGYSPLGGSGFGDGVVISKYAFGGRGWCGDISQNNNFDLGRTLTHELGHYFGLLHTWGNSENCIADDGIFDTPPQQNPNFGCAGLNVISCETKDMSMNFMDYSDDECMYMFTPLQVIRMEKYIQFYLPHLVENAYKVIRNLSISNPPVLPELPIDTMINEVNDTIVNIDVEPPIIFPTGLKWWNSAGLIVISVLLIFGLIKFKNQ